MKIRVALWVVLMGCLTAMGWLHAQSSGSRRTALTADDYHQISELRARFDQGSDFRDAEMFLSTFADDSVFQPPRMPAIVGKKALTEWRTQTLAGQTGDSRRRHWHGGAVLTPTTDGGAKARVYLMVLDVSRKQATLASTNYADDVYVKTVDGWKFKSRVIHPDAMD